MQQRTEAWYQIRLGRVTSSRIGDVLKKNQDGSYSSKREKYKAELICEILTGKSQSFFISQAMQHGIDFEDKAKQFYEMQTGNFVSEIAFVPHPYIEQAGCSPDGLIDDDGLIEIKCPETHNHIAFLHHQKPKDEYFYQMQWQMACTGRQWCDFISFDNRLPENLAIAIVRFERNDKLIAEMEKEVIQFLKEMDEEIQFLLTRSHHNQLSESQIPKTPIQKPVLDGLLL